MQEYIIISRMQKITIKAVDINIDKELINKVIDNNKYLINYDYKITTITFGEYQSISICLKAEKYNNDTKFIKFNSYYSFSHESDNNIHTYKSKNYLDLCEDRLYKLINVEELFYKDGINENSILFKIFKENGFIDNIKEDYTFYVLLYFLDTTTKELKILITNKRHQTKYLKQLQKIFNVYIHEDK